MVPGTTFQMDRNVLSHLQNIAIILYLEVYMEIVCNTITRVVLFFSAGCIQGNILKLLHGFRVL